jgi:tRNA nucleotidyltransferase (CCA-adding enzyme)
MQAMAEDGEADALAPERVWKETQNALSGAHPEVFFRVLRDCGALTVVFPEIDALFGVPQPPRWHPEIDCGVHTLLVVGQAAKLSPELDVRFAALVHDLGKATTPEERLPGHAGHEHRSVGLVKKLTERLPVPSACRDLALLVAEFHGHCHRAFELKPATVLKVLERCDAVRRPARFARFLLACEADARGRTGFESRPYPQADYLAGALRAASAVSADDLVAAGLSGIEIRSGMQKKRLAALTAWKAEQHHVP